MEHQSRHGPDDHFPAAGDTVAEGIKKALDELYRNSGLQGITDAAAEVLDNSIMINDTSYNILARSYRSESGKEFLSNRTGFGFISEDVVSSMREGNVFRRIRQSNAAVYGIQETTGYYWAFKTAKIAVISDNRPFLEGDFEFIDELSKIVAIEMQKNDFFRGNKGKAYRYFFQELFDGHLTDRNIIAQRARMLNWNLKEYFQVAVVDGKDWTVKKGDLFYVEAQLIDVIPNGKWAVYQQSVVAIFTGRKKELLTEHERELLNNFALDNHLSVGISYVFSDLRQTPVYYSQARHAGRVYQGTDKDSGVKFFSDVFLPHIIQALLQEDDYTELLYPPLTALQEYDETYKTEFVYTVRQYLLCGRNVSAASKTLCIHHNSMLYRLNRIRDVTGINFEDGEEFFKMMLHLQVLDYMEAIR